MSRRGGSRAASRTDSPVSLFPFLSVLICTMGTLILLLVVINRHARTQAAEQAEIKPDELIAELDIEAKTLEMFAQDMLASKEQANAEIENERARLATLESVVENLVAEIRRNEKTLKELDANRGNSNSEIGNVAEQLAAKRETLQRAEVELAELQKNIANRKKAYSIVPYRGPGGTERPPIYIECRSDCVVIHPEGIVLKEDDFLTASHPDNPLEALLRAASLYYTEQGLAVHNARPYPLIIVRPSGVDSYYAVRESLQSWGEHFGYELVEEDWKLEFPRQNEALKHRLEMQLTASRERMAPLKAMLLQRYMAANRLNGEIIPSRSGRQGGYGTNGGDVARAMPNGGMYGNRNYGPAGHQPDNQFGMQNAGSQGGQLGGMSGDIANGMPNTTMSGMPGGTLNDISNSAVNGMAASGHSADMQGQTGNGADGANAAGATQNDYADVNWREVMATVGNQTPAANGGKKKPKVEYRLGPNGDMVRYEDGVPREERVDMAKIMARQNADTSQNARQNAAQNTTQNNRMQPNIVQPNMAQTNTGYYQTAPQGFVPQGILAQETVAQNVVSQAATQNMSSQAAVPQPAYAGMPEATTGNATQTTAGTATGNMTSGATRPSGNQNIAPQNAGTGMPSLDMTFGDKETPPKNGWAMRDIEYQSSEIVRPIAVECLPDKIVIKRVGGAGIDQTVDLPANGGLRAVGNTFASHVLDYIDTWGPAARGTYWQPEMSVTVHPGAELRFEELKSLMQNSGVSIQQR